MRTCAYRKRGQESERMRKSKGIWRGAGRSESKTKRRQFEAQANPAVTIQNILPTELACWAVKDNLITVYKKGRRKGHLPFLALHGRLGGTQGA